MQKQQIPLKNSLFLLLAAIIWGIAFVAQSVGMEYVGGFTFSAVRSLLGSVVLIPLILISGRKNSADTAACLLIRKEIYDEVGGLDESYAVAFNDVDFCVRVRQAGYTLSLIHI